MSITSAELIFYGSANMQESDSGTQGGAIDLTTKVVFTDIAATDTIEVLSSSGADTTQTVTVTGRLASGIIDTEDFPLTGATPVNGATSFERVLKVEIDGAHTGTITIRRATGDTEIATMESGILTVRRLFYDASAEASGGSPKDIYEKIFAKNTNGSLALTNAAVTEQADPGANITFDLEDAKDDSNTATNRLTVPSGMLGSFDGSSKNVPSTNLGSGEAIGIWLKLTLAAGAAAAKNTYTLRLAGTTT